MKTLKNTKKSWQKPVIKNLDIKKDTFGGSLGTSEQQPQQTQKKRP